MLINKIHQQREWILFLAKSWPLIKMMLNNFSFAFNFSYFLLHIFCLFSYIFCFLVSSVHQLILSYAREVKKNIKSRPQGAIYLGKTPPSGGVWLYCPVLEASLKGGLGKFFYIIAVKPTLNLDLVSHSVATWAHWKIPIMFLFLFCLTSIAIHFLIPIL